MADRKHEDPESSALATRDGAPERALAKLERGEAWRGDEHELRLAAAREAGLDAREVELEFFTEGFKAGMVLDDPADHAIVIRGRTVLREKQLRKALKPTIRFLQVPVDQIALRIHDGEFELRVSNVAAEQGKPVIDSAKLVLKLWLGAGLVGLLAWNVMGWAWMAALAWGLGLLGGAYVLRQGMVSGRALLAARMVTSLAMMAQEEKLILPPARGGSSG